MEDLSELEKEEDEKSKNKKRKTTWGRIRKAEEGDVESNLGRLNKLERRQI